MPSNDIFKLIEKEVFSKVIIVHVRLCSTLEHESDCIRFTSNSEDDKFLMKHPVVQISAAVLREIEVRAHIFCVTLDLSRQGWQRSGGKASRFPHLQRKYGQSGQGIGGFETAAVPITWQSHARQLGR